MSNVGLSMQESSGGTGRAPKRPRGRHKRSGAAVFLAVVVVVGLLAAVGYGAYFVYQKVQSAGPAADYPGPGTGEIVIEVQQGQTLTDIGVTLQKADVVASTQAFADAAALEPEATSIMPGAYLMMKQMSAQGAVERLLDPAARNENVITISEGLRTDQVIDRLSASTGIKESEFEAVIESPSALPLPDWAEGTGEARAEGFLFPATYQFDKRATAKDMLTTMVEKFNTVAKEMGFEAAAKKTRFSPYEVLIIASLVQAEGHPTDFDKVSRVVYNRLDPDTWGGTFGYLGFDSTVNYVLKQSEINLSESDRDINSPYNTFTEHHQGLPPTPINNPGEAAMAAALAPAKGDWLYFVTTDPDTGETKFTNNYDEFLGFQQEFEDWWAKQQQQ